MSPALPILGRLPKYQRSWQRTDFIAELTVTAILIPQGMAYAQLAGVGPEAALYATPIGLVLYTVSGTSRQLVIAVSSAVAITSAATVVLLAPQGSSDYVALTAALAPLGRARVGRRGYLPARTHRAVLLSSSVLLGFVFALALIITIKQIPKIPSANRTSPWARNDDRTLGRHQRGDIMRGCGLHHRDGRAGTVPSEAARARYWCLQVRS